MGELSRTVRVILLVIAMSHLPVCSGLFESSRISLEPFDENSFKKSCRYGMVAEQDYFIVKGLINFNNIRNGQYGMFKIFYKPPRMDNYDIRETKVAMYRTPCTGRDVVKIDSCECRLAEGNNVHVKCNITAKLIYSKSHISLHYVADNWYYSPSRQLPTIFRTPVCIEPSVNGAAKSNPESITALLGSALLGTTAVFLVASIFSSG